MPDEQRCFDHILHRQLRVEGGERVVTRTVKELVDIAQHRATDAQVTATDAQAVLGRHGIRADDGQMLISNTAPALAAMLADTAWANCWPTVLARLPGASKAGVTHFRGLTSSRAVAIALDR